MQAKNIHSFPGFAKGKRAPDPKRDSVKFGDFLTVLPTVPLFDTAPIFNYPMDGNDRVGDCVVAGWDHSKEAILGLLTGVPGNFTQDQIWTFYKTQNPNFDPKGTALTNGPGSCSDNGMNIQNFLKYLQTHGYILGFASVNWNNQQELQAAIYLGLSVITGVILDEVQMQQFSSGIWSYVPNSPHDGGHCINLIGYQSSPEQYSCVTWGKIVQCTKTFLANQMDECWFILTQEHLDHPGFRNHFDIVGFSNAVSCITEGKIVIPTNPTIKIGATGMAVTSLQNRLNSNGATLIVDGIFGAKTQSALISFQRIHNLTPDGICGQKTWQGFEMIHIITEICNQQGVEPLLGVAVASWESALNPKSTLYNPPSKSLDRGLFQWNNVYHSEISDVQAFDPTQATTLFCKAVKEGRLHSYWSASQPNWVKMLTPDLIIKYHLA